MQYSNSRLKLISAGKVLNDSTSLGSQGVKNGQQILAITISETSTQVLETENQIKELENVKTDSRLLALDNEFMQVSNKCLWLILVIVYKLTHLEGFHEILPIVLCYI